MQGGGDPEREADFDKAYKNLVKKFYHEQGPNLLIPEEDLYRVEEQKIMSIEERQRRNEEKARLKEEKMRMMRQMQEEKEMEGCTFAP